MVAEVVWVDLKEIPDIGETLRPWRITDRVPVDGDSDGSVGRSDFGGLVQVKVLSMEINTYHTRQSLRPKIMKKKFPSSLPLDSTIAK